MTPHPNAASLKLTWRKSSRSNDSGNCVEVACLDGSASLIRDSKDPSGPALGFDRAAHEAFINAVSAGEFDFGLL
ncbi:DUF397 domain-containing protein [Kitasatospora sp. NPDC018058]|uniref:DUF397 domain-containing protein n=1 Tax=Kitasatospora sp. NPDC018058 TaxID=3364025 RepID=UPI0037BF99AF